MLPLILAIIVFVTVVLVVFSFGAAAVTPTSMLGARLRAQLLREHSLDAVVPLYRQAYDQVLGSAK